MKVKPLLVGHLLRNCLLMDLWHSVLIICNIIDFDTASDLLSPPLRRGGSFEDHTHEISGTQDRRSMKLMSAFLCCLVSKGADDVGTTRSELRRVHQLSEAHEISQMAAIP